MNIHEEAKKVRTALEEAVQSHVDSGNPDVVYYGFAIPGTLTSVSKWRIIRLSYTSSDFIADWADSDTLYNNKYSDRESLSYG